MTIKLYDKVKKIRLEYDRIVSLYNITLKIGKKMI